MSIRTPEECQFEADRDRLDSLIQQCMAAAEDRLNFHFIEMECDVVGLTQRNPFADSLANQQLIRQRIYANGQNAGYIIAVSSGWKPTITVTSSMTDPQQFILSVGELHGYGDAEKAMVDVLSQIHKA